MDRPVGNWRLTLEIDGSGSDEPLFLRIARSVIRDIERGRLAPGTRLPGTRALAESLAVHRNTVLAAFEELTAEGWIRTAPAQGTFVSERLPKIRPVRLTRASAEGSYPLRAGYDLPPLHSRVDAPEVPKGALSLAGGSPDVRLSPVTALTRAFRRALRRNPCALLSYANPAGEPHLREAIAQMLSANRGLPATAENVLVTRGSQMALYLVARTLLRPGDVVAVEAVGYPQAWAVFRDCGARLLTVPTDAEGMDVAALEALAEKVPLRAVFLTPHHHYPTTVTLSPGRRLRLLALAAHRRIALIEDDYDHEFHFSGRPVLPLASADRAGVVLYVGTLSKLLAPGLRVGYVVAPRPVLERIARHRSSVDRQGDQAMERAVAELIEDGEIQRHAWRARRIYQARRDALAELLDARLGKVLEFQVPSGGLTLWANTAEGVDPELWSDRGREEGVVFYPGRRFALDGRPRANVRLAYAALDEGELAQAVERLVRALPSPRRRSS